MKNKPLFLPTQTSNWERKGRCSMSSKGKFYIPQNAHHRHPRAAHFRGGQGAALLPAEPDSQIVLCKQREGAIGTHCPSLNSIVYEVRQALRSIKDHASPGEDGVGAAYFTYATFGVYKDWGKVPRSTCLCLCLPDCSRLCPSQEGFLLPGKLHSWHLSIRKEIQLRRATSCLENCTAGTYL
jgi:hypothetical protein